MRSLPGYFEHINGKTYLNRYPETIVKIDELKNKIFVEFGGGLGNDIKWLLDNGFDPKEIFFIEIDNEAYSKAIKSLKEKFGEYSTHLLLRDVRNTGLKDNFANFVYANNMLHCFETVENIKAVLNGAFRILCNGGVLFGRTLLDEIDKQKLKDISNPKNEDERFALLTASALQDGILIGLAEDELKKIAKDIGFSSIYTELIPSKWAPTTDFYFRFEK